MTRTYDNWDRLVAATLRREQLRLISFRTPSDLSLASSSSSFSFGSISLQASSFDFSRLSLGNSFTYHQILEATDSLSKSNLIKQGHSGDLYYGVLEDGIKVVIKKIDMSSLEPGSHHYVSELEFLHGISHSRLVPLMGHCLERMDKKFMVYKHMPQKDLSCYMYRQNVVDDGDRLQFSLLDWKTRLKIAIGAAEGLRYLHHECVPPIVHRDFQASSILLDDNFEVRLGSLSEVCTAVEQVADDENWIMKFLRLQNGTGRGTQAPANATSAHDVHCFGKVLLQLVTGRLRLEPPVDIPDPATPIGRAKTWKALTLQIYEGEAVRKILDPCLIIDEDVFLEVWAVAIVARACLNPTPSQRPKMVEVVKALKNGKITDSAYFEMKRELASYKTFFGPISPRLFK